MISNKNSFIHSKYSTCSNRWINPNGVCFGPLGWNIQRLRERSLSKRAEPSIVCSLKHRLEVVIIKRQLVPEFVQNLFNRINNWNQRFRCASRILRQFETGDFDRRFNLCQLSVKSNSNRIQSGRLRSRFLWCVHKYVVPNKPLRKERQNHHKEHSGV